MGTESAVAPAEAAPGKSAGNEDQEKPSAPVVTAAGTSKPTAVTVITNNAMAAKLWMGVAAFTLLTAIVSPCVAILLMKQKEKVIIFNAETGTVVYSPVIGWADAKDLHAFHAKLATMVLLHRNPYGLNHKELVDILFLPNGKAKLKKVLEASSSEFFEKQIRQNPEITEIKVMDPMKIGGYEVVRVVVTGQLIVDGTINEMAFREPYNFQLEVQLVRNPELTTIRKMALLVFDFNLRKWPVE